MKKFLGGFLALILVLTLLRVWRWQMERWLRSTVLVHMTR